MECYSVRTTSLSGGALVRAALLSHPAIRDSVTRIFPVAVPEATLPYMVYRRTAMQPVAWKSHGSDDTLTVEITVCTAAYDEGVRLAEAVREVFDGTQIEIPELPALRARRSSIVDACETYEADAYIQIITINIKIQ
ncbi:MAG: DUF3168 domain-containing protein [Muribaculaceae bacterium]|nr:DUF3168 domain-containing protein [Muribaculaceae bacterium]